jgi:hypothetical protein
MALPPVPVAACRSHPWIWQRSYRQVTVKLDLFTLSASHPGPGFRGQIGPADDRGRALGPALDDSFVSSRVYQVLLGQPPPVPVQVRVTVPLLSTYVYTSWPLPSDVATSV